MAGMKQYNEFLQAYLAANSGLPKQKAYTNAQEKLAPPNIHPSPPITHYLPSHPSCNIHTPPNIHPSPAITHYLPSLTIMQHSHTTQYSTITSHHLLLTHHLIFMLYAA
ncbi:hypothetical protein EB796_005871 [Bugula neritina]|uniref:Uncharacterized protein n=1 Tax=Bugula neritina TaxID=10212 RepID=A0A7J7KD82_BUGNE|nr:hypothetical protein EB796_005871 [Bugula neritina]